MHYFSGRETRSIEGYQMGKLTGDGGIRTRGFLIQTPRPYLLSHRLTQRRLSLYQNGQFMLYYPLVEMNYVLELHSDSVSFKHILMGIRTAICERLNSSTAF